MGRIDMAFDSDRLLCIERALDMFLVVQRRGLEQLLELDIAIGKQNGATSKHLTERIQKQILYLDLIMELVYTIEAERKERDEQRLGVKEE